MNALGGSEDEPLLITPDLLDDRVDFEKGMSLLPGLTLGLVVSHVAIFCVQVARGAVEEAGALVGVGALDSALVLEGGEIWRLGSATFLHAGPDHLIGNAIALYIAGMACEHAFRPVQFAVLYFVSAVAGSCLSLSWLPAGVPTVGASGAIFGLMGASAFAILRHSRRLYVRDKRVGVVLAAWILYSLVMGWIEPFVDNLAHLGGLAGGVLAAILMRPALFPEHRSPAAWTWGAFAGCCAATARMLGSFLPRLLG